MELLDRPILPSYTHFIFLFLATFLAVAINTFLITTFKNRSLVRRHGQSTAVRWTAQTKPPIGGIGFYLLFVLVSVFYVLFPFGAAFFLTKEIIALLLAASLGFVVGLIDDAYTTPPFFKFVGQLLCAIILIAFGVVIPLSEMSILNALFTIFWVVGIMNSVNMLDNMDGITASVSAVICLGILLLLSFSGQVNGFYYFTTLGVIAALLGFLYYNWYPAKAYMGDSGSQFLGAFLACMGILFMWQFKESGNSGFSLKQFLIPIALFLAPIVDTTTVVFRRIARGQSPLVGGRDHTTHHLAYCGWSDQAVAVTMIGLSLCSTLLTLWIICCLNNWQTIYTGLIIGYFLAVFGSIQYFYVKGKRRQDTVVNPPPASTVE